MARGAELTTVRDNLRHASVATTSIYLQSDEVKRARQMDQTSGRRGADRGGSADRARPQSLWRRLSRPKWTLGTSARRRSTRRDGPGDRHAPAAVFAAR